MERARIPHAFLFPEKPQLQVRPHAEADLAVVLVRIERHAREVAGSEAFDEHDSGEQAPDILAETFVAVQ